MAAIAKRQRGPTWVYQMISLAFTLTGMLLGCAVGALVNVFSGHHRIDGVPAGLAGIAVGSLAYFAVAVGGSWAAFAEIWLPAVWALISRKP